MKHLLTIILLALTCATLHAQSVIVQGSGQSSVRGVGANVKGHIIPATHTNYSDGQFTVWNTNQEVAVDNDSGFIWVRNAGAAGGKVWTNATIYCSNLVYANYDDWRLPSVTNDGGSGDWKTLVDTNQANPALPSGHPFTNVPLGNYWWSSVELVADPDDAWNIYLSTGIEGFGSKTETFHVWPVRGP